VFYFSVHSVHFFYMYNNYGLCNDAVSSSVDSGP